MHLATGPHPNPLPLAGEGTWYGGSLDSYPLYREAGEG